MNEVYRALLLAGLGMLALPVPGAAGTPRLAPADGSGHDDAPAGAKLHASVELGSAWQTRNDFRIPGDAGSLVRLADTEPGPVVALRATLTRDLTRRQSLRLLAAPLRLRTTFTPADAVSFRERVFPAGRPVEATYVFNSYRLTWFWRFPTARASRWALRLGATVKVRDAEIGLSGEPGVAVKTDLGVVPLLYAYASYQASHRFAFELEADAAAAPQGRAEDVSVKGVLRLSDRVDLDLGYRLLEGGADVDAVYTFAFFHYAVAALRIRF